MKLGQRPIEIGLNAAIVAVADRQPLARAHEGGPQVGREAPVQGGLHRDAALLPVAAALQPGGDHAGVVHHQEIAGAQQGRQVADPVILQGLARAHQQQARRIPRAGGPQGDAVGGQIEVEALDAHHF